MTRKILAVLTALVVCLSAFALCASAIDSTATPKGWEAHSIFDTDYAAIWFPSEENMDEYERFEQLPDTLVSGTCYGTNGCIQFFDGGHLYQNRCYALDGGTKIEIKFRGTGVNVGTHYRCPSNTCSDVSVVLDGTDLSTDENVLHDLNSIIENDTQEMCYITIDKLEYGDHILEVFVNSTPRLHVDFFELREGSTPYGVESDTTPADTTTAAATTAGETTTASDATTAGETTAAATTAGDTTEDGGFPIVPVVIAAVAVVAIVVVVIIVVSKKKK